jgi:hypothetical protein
MWSSFLCSSIKNYSFFERELFDKFQSELVKMEHSRRVETGLFEVVGARASKDHCVCQRVCVCVCVCTENEREVVVNRY